MTYGIGPSHHLLLQVVVFHHQGAPLLLQAVQLLQCRIRRFLTPWRAPLQLALSLPDSSFHARKLGTAWVEPPRSTAGSQKGVIELCLT